MKMSEIVANLAAGLREPLSDSVELVRAINARADELTGEQPKVLRAAGLKENHVRLRGRRGPGGGLSVTRTRCPSF